MGHAKKSSHKSTWQGYSIQNLNFDVQQHNIASFFAAHCKNVIILLQNGMV